MSALKDLHRKLHIRDNKDLLSREISPDNYDTDELKDSKVSDDGQDNSEKNEKKPDISIEKNNKFQETIVPENNHNEDFNNNIEEINLDNNQSGWSFKKKILIFGGAVLGLLILVGGAIGYVKYIQNSFKQERVLIDFQGSPVVKSGEILAHKLSVKNENRTALNTVKIKVFHPEELQPIYTSFMEKGPSNSFYINIDKIEKFQTKDYELQFEVYSPFDNQVYINTELNYQPENFSSNFNKENNFLVDVKGSIISFSLISTEEVASGELLKFIGILNNNGDKDFDNLILEIDAPDSFNFEQLVLDRVENSENRFKLPKLSVGEKREIEVVGSFFGEVDSVQRFSARVGVIQESGDLLEIVEAEDVVKIIPSRISITQEVVSGANSDKLIAEAGSSLSYKISFKNNSSSPLLDLILKEEIKGDLVNLDSFRLSSGYYDRDKQEIIWKASEVPALKVLNPGQSGSVEFSLSTKKNFMPDKERNQIVSTKAKISSLNIDTDIPSSKELSSSETTVKIKTNPEVLVSGNADDSVFNNEGPAPVEIGEETTFTVKVELKNDFNNIRNPQVSVKLPSGIIWKNSYHRSSGEVIFNERTNELLWVLDSLSPRTGYAKPLEELKFQVGLVPQKQESSNNINLVNEVSVSGYEEFVEENITFKSKAFTLGEVENYEF